MMGAQPARADDGSSPGVAVARRRRIVILTEDSKPALGGIAEYLHQLALAASTTHDVLVVTSVPGAETLNPGLPFRYREVEWYRPAHGWVGDGFMPWRRVNTLVWRLARRRRVRGILTAIHAEQPDSSYVIGRMSTVTRPWSVACADVGVSFAAIAYGLELVESLSRASQRRRAQTVAEATHWFAISRDTGEKLGRFGVPDARQTLLLPGVAPLSRQPSAEQRRAVRDRLGLQTKPFVMTLCYLRRRKGVDLGIEAFANLAAEFPDLAYVVAGAGPERTALGDLAGARGVADRVVFAESVDELTKAVLLSECTLFLLPVRALPDDVEGFGIVYLEAGQYGKAVIGGRTGGVPDAVSDGVTGILVDTRDAVELTAALRRLLGDPSTAMAMGERGGSRARTEFAWRERGLAFGSRLDALAQNPAGRDQRPTAVADRLRAGLGGATNRLTLGVEAARALVRRGRVAAYLTSVASPPDADSCARDVIGWVRRALEAGGCFGPDGTERLGGAAASYHIARGWAGAYPEITGYLIPTLLHYATALDDRSLADAASRAGVWLERTRLPGGAICRKQWFPGNERPSIFNTAQVLEGWCALARVARSTSRQSACDWTALAAESGRWLLSEQEPSGIWVRHAFNGIPHTYYARVAGPLARLADLTGDSQFADGARRAFDWVLSQQSPSGWFRAAGFTRTESPTTHAIGYVLEGLLQGGLLLKEPRYVAAADRGARALLALYTKRGALPGRLAPEWQSRARWRCLTGDAQVAIVWALLARQAGDADYRRAAERLATELRATVRIVPSWPEISGGIQGSSPRWGDYDPYGYPTHAAKFTLDLLALLRQ